MGHVTMGCVCSQPAHATGCVTCWRCGATGHPYAFYCTACGVFLDAPAPPTSSNVTKQPNGGATANQVHVTSYYRSITPQNIH